MSFCKWGWNPSPTSPLAYRVLLYCNHTHLALCPTRNLLPKGQPCWASRVQNKDFGCLSEKQNFDQCWPLTPMYANNFQGKHVIVPCDTESYLKNGQTWPWPILTLDLLVWPHIVWYSCKLLLFFIFLFPTYYFESVGSWIIYCLH